MLIKAGEFKRILSFVYRSSDPPLQPPTKNSLDLPCLVGKVDPNCMGLQVTWTLSFLWLTIDNGHFLASAWKTTALFFTFI